MSYNKKFNVVKTSQQELLEWKYINVLVMRAKGMKYKEIAEKVGVTETSVQRWFMRGGKLHSVFARFAAVAKEQSTEETLNLLYGHLPEIMSTLIQTAQLPYDMAGVAAGTRLMEWGLGKASDKAQGKGTGPGGQLTYADYVKQQTIADEEAEKNASTELQNKSEGAGAVPS